MVISPERAAREGGMVAEERMRRPLTAEDLRRMRVPGRFWDASLGEICAEGDPSPQEIARRYMAKLDEMVRRGIGLLLWGPNGRGKTCMAVVIGKEARRRGYTVLFGRASELKSMVIERAVFDADQSMWARMLSVDLLIVDDLGKGTQDSTGFGARLIDDLLRQRASERKVTILTTNMSPRDQMPQELKQSTMHTLKECVVPVHVAGPDRRDSMAVEAQALLSS